MNEVREEPLIPCGGSEASPYIVNEVHEEPLIPCGGSEASPHIVNEVREEPLIPCGGSEASPHIVNEVREEPRIPCGGSKASPHIVNEVSEEPRIARGGSQQTLPYDFDREMQRTDISPQKVIRGYEEMKKKRGLTTYVKEVVGIFLPDNRQKVILLDIDTNPSRVELALRLLMHDVHFGNIDVAGPVNHILFIRYYEKTVQILGDNRHRLYAYTMKKINESRPL